MKTVATVTEFYIENKFKITKVIKNNKVIKVIKWCKNIVTLATVS